MLKKLQSKWEDYISKKMRCMTREEYQKKKKEISRNFDVADFFRMKRTKDKILERYHGIRMEMRRSLFWFNLPKYILSVIGIIILITTIIVLFTKK